MPSTTGDRSGPETSRDDRQPTSSSTTRATTTGGSGSVSGGKLPVEQRRQHEGRTGTRDQRRPTVLDRGLRRKRARRGSHVRPGNRRLVAGHVLRGRPSRSPRLETPWASAVAINDGRPFWTGYFIEPDEGADPLLLPRRSELVARDDVGRKPHLGPGRQQRQRRLRPTADRLAGRGPATSTRTGSTTSSIYRQVDNTWWLGTFAGGSLSWTLSSANHGAHGADLAGRGLLERLLPRGRPRRPPLLPAARRQLVARDLHGIHSPLGSSRAHGEASQQPRAAAREDRVDYAAYGSDRQIGGDHEAALFDGRNFSSTW